LRSKNFLRLTRFRLAIFLALEVGRGISNLIKTPFLVLFVLLVTLGLSQNAFADPLTLFPTFVDSFSVAGQDTNPQDVAFSSDGTKMFVVGSDGDAVNEYTLTTAFDVSTAAFVDFFSVAAQETSPSGVAFSTDGTKMFVVGFDGDAVNEYTLTTAFDVSTASFVDFFSVVAQETGPTGVAFSSDGTKMFVVGSNGDAVNEYTLTTAFDVSTAAFVDFFSVAAQDDNPQGVAFSSDGIKMFVVDFAGDAVNEYTLTTAFDVSTAAFVDFFSVAAQDSAPLGIAFSTNGFKMFVVGAFGDAINEYTLPSDFSLFPTFVDSFSVFAQDTFPNGLAFSSDGTKMFVVGAIGDDINEYTLSTAFDVSTASFVDSKSVTAEDTSPTGVAFNSDGTKMFVVGNAGDAVNEYTLTTAFDVSTAAFVDSFSVATEETSPQGVAFSTNGFKMFVVGFSGDDINEYTLSTAFDLSDTVTFVDSKSVAAEDTSPTGVAFSSDGTKMFVVGNAGDAVNEYTLTTAFDVSTAAFVDSFSVSAQEIQPTGVAFSTNGFKMFVVGSAGDDINEYTLIPTILCMGMTPTITGTTGADTLTGTAGVDVIVGRGGDDTINGLGGDDIICAGDGDDIVTGGGDNDTIDGGYGNDFLRGNAGDDTIYGRAGIDHVRGNAGTNTLFGGEGDDSIFGGGGVDTINGDAGNDFISSSGGNDVVNGGDGDDTIFTASGDDTVNGDGGNDTILGSSGTNTLSGDAGNDHIKGGSGVDTITGGDGNDSLRSGGGVGSTVDGGDGIDICPELIATNCELKP